MNITKPDSGSSKALNYEPFSPSVFTGSSFVPSVERVHTVRNELVGFQQSTTSSMPFQPSAFGDECFSASTRLPPLLPMGTAPTTTTSSMASTTQTSLMWSPALNTTSALSQAMSGLSTANRMHAFDCRIQTPVGYSHDRGLRACDSHSLAIMPPLPKFDVSPLSGSSRESAAAATEMQNGSCNSYSFDSHSLLKQMCEKRKIADSFFADSKLMIADASKKQQRIQEAISKRLLSFGSSDTTVMGASFVAPTSFGAPASQQSLATQRAAISATTGSTPFSVQPLGTSQTIGRMPMHNPLDFLSSHSAQRTVSRRPMVSATSSAPMPPLLSAVSAHSTADIRRTDTRSIPLPSDILGSTALRTESTDSSSALRRSKAIYRLLQQSSAPSSGRGMDVPMTIVTASTRNGAITKAEITAKCASFGRRMDSSSLKTDIEMLPKPKSKPKPIHRRPKKRRKLVLRLKRSAVSASKRLKLQMGGSPKTETQTKVDKSGSAKTGDRRLKIRLKIGGKAVTGKTTDQSRSEKTSASVSVSKSPMEALGFAAAVVKDVSEAQTLRLGAAVADLCVGMDGNLYDPTVDWRCGVCLGADADAENVLIVCEGCSRAFHALCLYAAPGGVPTDEDYFCDVCAFKRKRILQKRPDLAAFTLALNALTPPKADVFLASDEAAANYAAKYREFRGEMKQFFEAENASETTGEKSESESSSGKQLVEFPKCALCPNRGGGYTQTEKKLWVHLACGLWNAAVHWRHSDELSLGVPKLRADVSKASHSKKCCVCALSGRRNGYALKCSRAHCLQRFHVTCALEPQSLCAVLVAGRKLARVAYCPEHVTAKRRSLHLASLTADSAQNSKTQRAQKRNFSQMSKGSAKSKKAKLSGGGRGRGRGRGTRLRGTGKRRGRPPGSGRGRGRPRGRGRAHGKAARRVADRQFVPRIFDYSQVPTRYIVEYRTVDKQLLAALQLEEEKEAATGSESQKKTTAVASLISERSASQKAKAKKRRRKSTVDVMNQSSLFLRPSRDSWFLDQTWYFYPAKDCFLESLAAYRDADARENEWRIESTTCVDSALAKESMQLIEELWGHRQTNVLPKTSSMRKYRKAIGFSVLKNPFGEGMSSAQWSVFEVAAARYALLIKLFLTKATNAAHITQRRKKNGSLLAAHILDLAFSPYSDHCKPEPLVATAAGSGLRYVVISSEKGSADSFWKACGFRPFAASELNSFSRATERDINQFKDTHLLRMSFDEYMDRFCAQSRTTALPALGYAKAKSPPSPRLSPTPVLFARRSTRHSQSASWLQTGGSSVVVASKRPKRKAKAKVNAKGGGDDSKWYQASDNESDDELPLIEAAPGVGIPEAARLDGSRLLVFQTATAVVFDKWKLKHRFAQRKLIWKMGGTVVHSSVVNMYSNCNFK